VLVIDDSVAKFTDMGMKYLPIIWLTFFATLSSKAGTPAQAQAVAQEYEALMDAWQAELAGAQSMEMMRQVVKKKPDAEAYMKRMIGVVGAEFKNPWSLKYAGWLMVNTPLEQRDKKIIMDYANKFHMDAPDLGSFCYDVALSEQTFIAKKTFIEKAAKVIKDPKQKGIAAISLAIVLSEMGDTAVNNARRLSLIKEAIIESNNETVRGVNVGDIAMEMVHRIKNISKGLPAPAISAVDSSGAPMTLAQYKGKVVMLVFWSSFDLPEEKTVDLLELMRKIEKQYAGKNFALIGVNKDQLMNLRELEKGAVTSSINISDPQQKIFRQYRVENPPHCYVIDQQGRIQFTGIVGSFATLTVDALLNPLKR
jgi:peroxiredoxin